MKRIFSLLSLSLLLVTAAQAQKFSFSGKSYRIPEGFTADGTANNLQSADGNTSFRWTYFADEQAARIRFESEAAQMEESVKTFHKKILPLSLAGKTVSAYRLQYQTAEGKSGYRLLAYGTANGQPVLVELWTPLAPTKNSDLPEGIRDILRF